MMKSFFAVNLLALYCIDVKLLNLDVTRISAMPNTVANKVWANEDLFNMINHSDILYTKRYSSYILPGHINAISGSVSIVPSKKVKFDNMQSFGVKLKWLKRNIQRLNIFEKLGFIDITWK